MSVNTQLKQLMADAMVMFSKLHNYHWNVKGLHFYAMHDKTEQAYNQFAVMYDDLAERLLQLGEKPLVTLKDILATAKIEEDAKTDFNAEYVIKALLHDYNYFLKAFQALSDAAKDDATTMAYADEQVSMLEKEIWMLNANLG